jgi:hypothetical protein
MSAFVIAPIKKARSCPNLLYMSEPVSPTTIQKEIAIGTAMAVTSVFITGEHHHLITLNEIRNTLATETVNVITNLKYERSPLIDRIYRLKKHKLFIFAIMLPIIIRILSFMTFQLIF